MLVLGIESTCDETACAIVRNGKEIVASTVSSQIDLHAEYGGVVPELACRRHVDVMIPVIKETLIKGNLTLSEIDLVAVSQGPGLIGALLLGINTAKAISLGLNKPLIGVNHIEAHLYAAVMSHPESVSFPCLGLVLSGGHTSLFYMKDFNSYSIIGHTVDDAIGEAFDKVAKIMGLSYPGGPQIEKLATTGNAAAYSFNAGQVKGSPLHFSFSGLKTAVLYAMRDCPSLTHSVLCDISASFQRSAFQDVITKTLLAAKQLNIQTILFGGGVTNNHSLRRMFSETASNYQYLWPSPGLSLDNAAMIAGLGYQNFIKNGSVSQKLDLEAFTR